MSLEKEIKKISSTTAINDICKLFDKKKIKYEASQAEIVVHGKKKKEIKKLISSLKIDKIDVVLDIVETKKKLYIRQRIA